MAKRTTKASEQAAVVVEMQTAPDEPEVKGAVQVEVEGIARELESAWKGREGQGELVEWLKARVSRLQVVVIGVETKGQLGYADGAKVVVYEQSCRGWLGARMVLVHEAAHLLAGPVWDSRGWWDVHNAAWKRAFYGLVADAVSAGFFPGYEREALRIGAMGKASQGKAELAVYAESGRMGVGFGI